MRLVYSHGCGHQYDDAATHVAYVVPADGVSELPDEVAEIVLAGHPQKLCDVTGEGDPARHRCAITERLEEAMERRATASVPGLVETAPATPMLTQRQKRARLSALRRDRNTRAAVR